LKDIIKYSLIFVNIIVALLLAGSYLVSYVSPEQLWYPVFLGLSYPYLLLANIVFVVFWMFAKWKYAFLSLFVIMSGINYHHNYIQLLSKPHYKGDDGINLLSFNVHHFYSYLENENPGFNVIDFIASHEADIICLQETKLQQTGELNPIKLKSRLPNINHCQLAHQSKWNGPVTFTKYPIVNMGEIRFEDSGNMVMYTDIVIEKDTIRVYNCHLQSFGIKTNEYSVIDTLGLEHRKIEEIKLIGWKMRDAYIKRARQANVLHEHIKECNYPVIVCGDFNDTPLSYTYKVVGDGLIDAFVESGGGISNTYRGKLPPFRIDYIFYSDYFEGFNYKKHNVEYSDHLPISTVLKIRNNK